MNLIQTALFFVLGFLSAAFLALLVAPTIWRRAVALTKRRIEGALPLSMDEIRADKDRVRAEFAVSARQLEMKIKSLRETSAAQKVELGRNAEELARLAAEVEEKDRAAAEMKQKLDQLQARSASFDETVAAMSSQIESLVVRLEEQQEENRRLGHMFDEASFSASSRQIELVSRDSKLAKLSDDIGALRNERKELQTKLREGEAERKAMELSMREDKKKGAALERKMAQMTTSLTDSEEKLERRSQEVARLREELKARVNAPSANPDSVALLVAQQRLEERLTRMTRENKKLRTALEASHTPEQSDEDRARENAILRDRISMLAAEVVNLTATMEGPDSPIHGLLEKPREGATAAPPSLADRIIALREDARLKKADRQRLRQKR
jgi:chromosome segregation ATPase